MTLDLTQVKVYAVGGYVRDRLLGRDPKDHDYVVVGATPDDMIAAGFEPIEASFPVFLHPVSRDEYALARQDRKVGIGYHGFDCVFDPSVTIEADLYRRDLTVNAMARQVLGWSDEGHAQLSDEIVDPYNGQKDLKAGILRHVSEAFAEDPVRVLRTARFAARYGFTVPDTTMDLMRLVTPELNYVPQERIWAEFEKGLMEAHPLIMIDVLHRCSALKTDALHPYAGADLFSMQFIKPDTPMHVRFALLAHGFNDEYDTCRIPTHLARVSKAVNKHTLDLAAYIAHAPDDRLRLLEQFRALSEPSLIQQCIDVVTVHLSGVIGESALHRQVRWDLANISKVDAASVAASCKTGQEIKQKLFDSRVASM